MSHTARCTSCGAPVSFLCAASIMAVCGYCRTTLVREDDALRTVGRMGELLQDQSPIRLAAQGRWHGLHFTVIGRIQLRYDQGAWNEWHVMLDDGASAWVSEVAGELYFTREDTAPAAAPAFAALQVGASVQLGVATYEVTNLLEAECIAGEGELPFVVGQGYAARVADLRNSRGDFASLDYSDDEARPRAFVGQSLAFEDVAWVGLAEVTPLPEVDTQAHEIRCPGCGSPITLSGPDIVSVGCAACGALLDTSQPKVKLLAAARQELTRIRRLLEPGIRGRLRGQDVQVLGFLRRSGGSGIIKPSWDEYLLVDAKRRPLWLSEWRGHWNLCRTLPRTVKAIGTVVMDQGVGFEKCDRYSAQVDYAIGEFPWRVRVGEQVLVTEFLAVPRLLACEENAQERTWTMCEYLEPAEVAAAFALKTALPEPRGVYINQPNPHAARLAHLVPWFAGFAALALVVHLALLAAIPRPSYLQQTPDFLPGQQEVWMSDEFEVPSAQRRLEVDADAPLWNQWIELDLNLVNRGDGRTWHAVRELSEYHGIEDGDSWTEDAHHHSLDFPDVPAGRYVLAVDHDMEAQATPAHVTFTVRRPPPRWANLWLMLAVLGLVPGYVWLRSRAFEGQRGEGG